ncbi:MAG: hypothetical protein WCB11_14650 [Terriglobales bacterium]
MIPNSAQGLSRTSFHGLLIQPPGKFGGDKFSESEIVFAKSRSKRKDDRFQL